MWTNNVLVLSYICVTWHTLLYMDELRSQHGKVITYIIKYGMKLLIHSQALMAALFKFGNGLVISQFTGACDYILDERIIMWTNNVLVLSYICVTWHTLLYMDELRSQHGKVITYIIKYGMKLLIHSQALMAALFKFGNGLVISQFTGACDYILDQRIIPSG